MRSLMLLLLLAACEPPAIWTPSSGTTTPASVDAQRPYLYLDRAPATWHENGHLEVHQEGLAVVSLATLFSSLRKEAAKRGCDGLLVRSGDWIVDGLPDDGRIGVFVSLYVHGELRVDGVRAACVMLN